MYHNNIIFKVTHRSSLENGGCGPFSNVHGIVIDLRLTGLTVEQLLAGLSIVGADIIAEMIGSIVIHGQKQAALVMMAVIIFVDNILTADIVVKRLAIVIAVLSAEYFIIAENGIVTLPQPRACIVSGIVVAMILHHVVLYHTVFANLCEYDAVTENLFDVVSTEGDIAECLRIAEAHTLCACILSAGTNSFLGYIFYIVIFNQDLVKSDIGSHLTFRLPTIDPDIGADYENSAGHLGVGYFCCHIVNVAVLNRHIRHHAGPPCGKHQDPDMIIAIVSAVCHFNSINHPVALITQQDGWTVHKVFSDFIL